jgi:predicted RNase H-like HicB family nuclease
MKRRTYTIEAHWDSEVRVWVAESSDVPGLATEAPSLDRLIKKLRVMIPELLQANGTLRRESRQSNLPISIIAHYDEKLRLPA